MTSSSGEWLRGRDMVKGNGTFPIWALHPIQLVKCVFYFEIYRQSYCNHTMSDFGKLIGYNIPYKSIHVVGRGTKNSKRPVGDWQVKQSTLVRLIWDCGLQLELYL
jgi:hypothetical protein